MLPTERTDFRPPFPLEEGAPEPRDLRVFCGGLSTAAVAGLPLITNPFPEPEGPTGLPASGPIATDTTSVALFEESAHVGGGHIVVGEALAEVQLIRSESAKKRPSLPLESGEGMLDPVRSIVTKLLRLITCMSVSPKPNRSSQLWSPRIGWVRRVAAPMNYTASFFAMRGRDLE